MKTLFKRLSACYRILMGTQSPVHTTVYLPATPNPDMVHIEMTPHSAMTLHRIIRQSPTVCYQPCALEFYAQINKNVTNDHILDAQLQDVINRELGNHLTISK